MLDPYSHRENAVRAHTGARILAKIQQKRLNSFKQGRINVRKEVRRQRRLRNNLEKMAFRRLSSLLPKHIRTQASIFKVSGSFSRNASNRQLENELFAVMSKHYRRIFMTVFKDNESRYEKINKSVDVTVFGRNRDIERLISVYNNDRNLYLANMTQSVTRNIQNVITKGRADGATLDQISRNIRNTAPIARRRAAAIARTETHNAASFAQHEYHGIIQNEYGVNMMKKWAATNDLRTRSAHSAVNGQTRAMDEAFDVGGAQMMHAGDPKGGAKNVINCRCVIIYVDADDIVDGKKPRVNDAPSGDDYVPNIDGYRLGRTLGSLSTIRRSQNGGGELARQRLRQNFKDAAPKWGVANKPHKSTHENTFGTEYTKEGLMHRFRGFSQNKVGSFKITKNQLKKAGYTDEQADMFFQALDEAIQDCNALARKFKVPPIRGVGGARNAQANMGDGILGLNMRSLHIHFRKRGDNEGLTGKIKRNADFDRNEYAKIYPRNPEIKPWRDIDGETQSLAARIRSKRPHLSDAYLDDGIDQFKNTIYHEFAHNIHQTHGINLKSATEYMATQGSRVGRGFNTKLESLIRTKYFSGDKRSYSDTLAPSIYGQTNPHEWFAENFSLWVVGKDSVVSPSFLKLMEEIIELTTKLET